MKHQGRREGQDRSKLPNGGRYASRGSAEILREFCTSPLRKWADSHQGLDYCFRRSCFDVRFGEPETDMSTLGTGFGGRTAMAAAAGLLLIGGGYWIFAHRADPAHGQQLYRACIGCHAPQRILAGPPHCGLFGRKAGSVAGYPYSDAMRHSEIVWDAGHLNDFLESPLTYLPGTTMGFVGLSDPGDRRDLVAFLREATAGDGGLCSATPAGSEGADVLGE
jgi:cytochrome c